VLTIVLIKITLLVIVAYLVAISLRRASAGARHLVWLATLGGLVMLPAALQWRPIRVPVLPPSANYTAPSATEHAAARSPIAVEKTAAPSATASPAASVSPSTLEESPIPTVQAMTAGSAFASATRYSVWLVGLWALGVLALVARLVHGLLTVRRISHTAPEVDGAAWRAALHEVADRLDMEELPRLVVSNAVRVPFACGFRRPTIVLPTEAMSWTDERRRVVLLHELAHIQRRDMFGHLLSRLACVMYWFHPLVWMAARHLRAESERACDDLAIRSGARASDYAQHLLDIVTSIRGPVAPAVACTMARKRDFEGRMLAILDPERRRGTPSRVRAMALVGALGALYAVIGIAVLAPRAAVASARPLTRTAQVATIAAPPVVGAKTRTSIVDETPAPRPVPIPATAPAAAPATASATASVTTDVTSNLSVAMPTQMREHLHEHLQEQAREPSADSIARRWTLLISILRSDSSASLRKVAAWGLEQFHDEDPVRGALATALRHDSDTEVREMAAWALEGVEGDNVVTALSDAVREDHDPSVRATAAWSLASDCKSISVPLFVTALHDADSKVRASAAWALGQCDLEHAPSELGALLSDPEPRVRKMATWALFNIKDPSTEPAIEKALQSETDGDLRRDMVRAIAAMGERSPEAVERLLDSKDPSTRELAVHALAGDHLFVWPMPWPRPRPTP
jgi:beta-lactamase regulating signal transducer with metallopeptidase domain/HEAT repeat protein